MALSLPAPIPAIVPTQRAAVLIALAAPLALLVAALAPGAWIVAPAAGGALLALVVLDAVLAGRLSSLDFTTFPEIEVGVVRSGADGSACGIGLAWGDAAGAGGAWARTREERTDARRREVKSRTPSPRRRKPAGDRTGRPG